MRNSILLPVAILSVLGTFSRGGHPDSIRMAVNAPAALVAAGCAQRLAARDTALVATSVQGAAPVVQAVSSEYADVGLVSVAEGDLHTDLAKWRVATSGLVFVVHPHRSLEGLSSAQVASLLTGQLANWQQLRGPDAPISLLTPVAAAREQLGQVFGVSPDAISGRGVASDRTCERLVSGDPFAIGCMTLAAAQQAIQRGVQLKILALDGVEPTSESVSRHEWPLTNSLFLLARSQDAAAVGELLELLSGPAGAAALAAQGYENSLQN